MGDGEYSVGEAAFDAAGGALGGSAIKAGATIGSRTFTVGRAHFSKSTSFSYADDAVGTTAAIVSGNIKPIGIAVTTSYLGDQYTHAQSSASRSEQNASDVGAGGKLPNMVKPNFNKARNVKHGKRRSMFCPEGYELRKVDKKWMCVRIRK